MDPAPVIHATKQQIQQLIRSSSKRIDYLPVNNQSSTARKFTRITLDGQMVEDFVACSHCHTVMTFGNARKYLTNLRRHLEKCRANDKMRLKIKKHQPRSKVYKKDRHHSKDFIKDHNYKDFQKDRSRRKVPKKDDGSCARRHHKEIWRSSFHKQRFSSHDPNKQVNIKTDSRNIVGPTSFGVKDQLLMLQRLQEGSTSTPQVPEEGSRPTHMLKKDDD